MIASNALQNLQNVFLDQPLKKEQCIRILAIVDYLKFFNVVIIEGNKT